MDVGRLMKTLARNDLSEQQRSRTEAQVLSLGTDAIGPLIAHLKDAKVIRTRNRIVNENLLVDAPAVSRPRPEAISRREDVSLGEDCRRLLLRVITPRDYKSPHESRRKPISAGPDQWMFRIKDWEAWWEKNKSKPLSQIQEELKPVIDKYWQELGTEQVIQ